MGAITHSCNGLENVLEVESDSYIISATHTLEICREPSCPKFMKRGAWYATPFLPPSNPLPCPADLPQGLSWSGRSQCKRNSVGRPSGLRWLSYTPQSDSTKHNEKYKGTEICPICLLDIKLEIIQPPAPPPPGTHKGPPSSNASPLTGM